jgi:hypothetical protein
MAIYHVNLGFATLADTRLDAFAEKVVAKLAGNAAFPSPPVSVAGLESLLGDYTSALAAAADGGKMATAVKNSARAALVAALREVAIYVLGQGSNDVPKLLSSGFSLSSTSRTRSSLAAPAILRIVNGVSGELRLSVTPIRNAKAYELQTSTDNGASWEYRGTSTQARVARLRGLSPGTLYQIQVRAVGGTTGYSDWSDAVSHMAT